VGLKFHNDDDVMSDINIAPFVDIILVVLIIFMVTATKIAEKSILVKLPSAATGEANPDTLSLGLTLLENGDLLLDGLKITPDALKAKVKTAVDADQDVVIRGAIQEIMNHPELTSQGVDFILIAKNLERIADHATNVAEDVILAKLARNVKHASKLRG